MKRAVAGVVGLPGKAVAAIMRRRARLPRFVNRAIDGVLDNPRSRLYRFLSRAASPFSASDIPAPTRRPRTLPAVYIAPANYAGQGHQWARALRAAGIDAANLAVVGPGAYSFPADSVVPVSVQLNSSVWQRAEFDAAVSYGHVLIEAERQLFGTLFDADVRREVEELGREGVSVAMISHGTDVRIPSRHSAAHELSPFADPGGYFDRVERMARRNVALLEELGRPTFVSTPDLLDFVPFAHWCPVTIDPARWTAPRTPDAGPLRVVHAPTDPQLKGTALVEPTLERLDRAGVISYRRLERIPHEQMPARFAEADVVLDQFRLGLYSVTAVEAMAAGCVAIAHVPDRVRRRVADATGRDLPVVEAAPDELERVLVELAEDRDRREAIAAESRVFAGEVHDGRLSAVVLHRHWIDGEAP